MECSKTLFAGSVGAFLVGTLSVSAMDAKNYTFDSVPDAHEMAIGSSQEQFVNVKDGVLKIHSNGKDSFFGGVTFPLQQYAAEAFQNQSVLKISFRMCKTGRNGNPNYHCGIFVSNAKNERVRMLYYANTNFTVDVFNGKTAANTKNIGGFSGKDNDWHDLVIVLSPDEYTLYLKGRKVYQAKVDMTAVQKLFIYGFNVEFNIDDLKIEAIKE